MFAYLIRRVLIMIPTLLAISLITFVIIQLPPGDYLSNQVAELQSQGESAALDEIEAAAHTEIAGEMRGIESEMRELEQGEGVEDELAALKEKLGPGKGSD